MVREQVVTNFVSNAAKFTPAGGQVKMTAMLCQPADAAQPPSLESQVRIRFAVKDSGIGISEADQVSHRSCQRVIFEVFYFNIICSLFKCRLKTQILNSALYYKETSPLGAMFLKILWRDYDNHMFFRNCCFKLSRKLILAKIKAVKEWVCNIQIYVF